MSNPGPGVVLDCIDLHPYLLKKMFVRRPVQYFNFCVSKRMVAMVNDEILYTFNSKCQKSSKSHASFFILKISIMILVF